MTTLERRIEEMRSIREAMERSMKDKLLKDGEMMEYYRRIRRALERSMEDKLYNEAIKRSIETAEREEAWRMKRAMMKFAHHLKMEGAVLTIQRMWRGRIVRHSLYEQAHEARLAELVKNITTIQRMWRGRVCAVISSPLCGRNGNAKKTRSRSSACGADTLRGREFSSSSCLIMLHLAMRSRMGTMRSRMRTIHCSTPQQVGWSNGQHSVVWWVPKYPPR